MSSLQKHALHAQHNNIRARLNPDSITPYLNQQDLLTDDEFEKLCGRELTRSQKINLIVQVLPYKGRDWWNKFLCCLKESATEPGLPAHQELVFLLENELTEQYESQKQNGCVQRIKLLIQQSFYVFKKFVKLAYKIAVVIAVLVLLYDNYYNNVVLTSQPKKNTDTGGILMSDHETGGILMSDHEIHSRSTDGARETSLAVSYTPTTTRVIQTPEAPGPGPIDFNSFLVTQIWLNETHCLFYFVVENRTIPHQFANSKLWNIYEILNFYPIMYDKYFSILESLLTTFDVHDEDYYSPFTIVKVLIDLLETTSVSFTKTIQQDCRIDDTYWLKEVVIQQFSAS